MTYKPKIYTASKIHHKESWKMFRYLNPELEFTARWIDHPPGPDHDSTAWTNRQKTRHWIEDIQDVQRSDWVLIYSEPRDVLRGSYIEAGAAIGLGKPVLTVGMGDHDSWIWHPLVVSFESIQEALWFVLGRNPPNADL